MSRRFQRRAILSACLLACLTSTALGQQQSSSDDTVYHLQGVVLNGVTGKPIGRALVESADRRLAAMTDGEGRFAIEVKVPPKTANGVALTTVGMRQLNMMVEKPGYVTNTAGRMIALADGTQPADVELKLMPGAAVSGRIYSSEADPPSETRVNLLNRSGQAGRLVWRQTGSQTADRQGNFHFSGLRPGEYTVMVGGSIAEGALPALPGKITQQFSPTYYGDSADMATANKVHLHYGETIQADLHLHLTTCYPVTIPIETHGAGFAVRMTGKDEFSGYRIGYNDDRSAFEIALPNGTYNFLITSGGQRGGSSAEVAVHVEGVPVKTAPVVPAPNAAVLIRVETQFTHAADQMQNYPSSIRGLDTKNGVPPQPALVQFNLRAGEGLGEFHGKSAPEGESSMEDLHPGTYTLDATAMRGYIASATSGGTDLMREPLMIASGGLHDPIEIVLRDDFAKISGTVTTGDAVQVPSATVIFLPTDSTARYNQLMSLDGKFSNVRLSPGTYRVIAFIGEFPQIAYLDNDTMRSLEGKGVTVSVGPDESKEIAIPLIDASVLESH